MAAARAWFILALVVAAVVVEGGAARPPSMTQQQRQQVESLLRRLNKPPLATIQSPDGDIIDCVHISKQPAFDHPLLKNHTIQMRPFSYPRDLHNASNIAPQPISQTWHQNGRCPENTIPIRRTKEEDVLRASSISMFGKKRPGSIPNHNSFEQSVTSGHEWATASSSADRYYGTKATFNLWQPNIERSGDFSLTQLWIIKGSYSATISTPLKQDGRFTQGCMVIEILDYSSIGLVMHIKRQDATTYAQGLSRQIIRSPSVAASPLCPPMVAHNMNSVF